MNRCSRIGDAVVAMLNDKNGAIVVSDMGELRNMLDIKGVPLKVLTREVKMLRNRGVIKLKTRRTSSGSNTRVRLRPAHRRNARVAA